MRVTRKVLSAGLFLTCAVALLAPSQAVAGVPGYPGCTIEITPTEAAPGESVQVVGSGFQPGFTTEIFIDGISVGTVTTNAAGEFETDVEVPAGAGPGTVTVTAACDGTGDNVATTEFIVLGDTAPTLTVSPTVVERGDQVVATVTGAQPGVTVQFSRGGVPLGSVTTDAQGNASITFTIPADAPLGAHEIQATVVDAEGNTVVLTGTIQVVADSAADGGATDGAAGGGDLPRTGDDVEPLVVVGGLAILAGIAFVLVAMRRRQGSAPGGDVT